MEAFLIPAAAGFAGGVLRAVWGFAKSRKKGESFDKSRFAATLVEAGIAGAVCGAVTLNPVAAFFAAAGVTSLADKLRETKALPECK